MKDKEKQITEMANISTKEEIEARNKRGKEKDELRQALLHYATAEASGGIKSLIDCEGCAFYLYENLGYRKLPEGSVVLSREEICELKYQSEEDFSKAYDLGSKETAEKILKDFKLWAREHQNKDTVIDDYGERPMTNNEKLNYLYTYLCDKYKVEIKE